MRASLRLFDDHFESMVAETQATGRLRVVMILLISPLLIFSVSLSAAIGWCAGNLLVEVWLWAFNRGPADRVPSRRLRFARLLGVIGSSAGWSAMAVLQWSTGHELLRIGAILQLATLLMIAQAAASKSITASVGYALAPVIFLIALPLTIPGQPLIFTVGFVFCLAVALLYFVSFTRMNMAAARLLARTQSELVEETQRAIAASQAKSSFLAMMSHEIRTPMNGVLGMAHALRSTELRGPQSSYVEMLLRSGDGLMSILNDILDISKIEAGRFEIESIPFDLQQLIDRVHDLWADAASNKGVGLVCEFDPALSHWFMGDPTRVRQVTLNLVSNALKFTTEGEVRISVRPVRVDGLERVEIAVSDTGPGMSREAVDSLFTAFTQTDVSVARKFGGTGLGLAICRQLIGLMGGDIAVESRVGEGSVFRATLPLEPCDAEEETLPEAAVLSLIGRAILVVDDNAINQAVARAILEAVGATVLVAEDGLVSLEILAREAVDLVLMDVHMPRMGGIEAVGHIRAGDAGEADIPIIALTADAMAGVEEELVRNGFDAASPKPIQPLQLIGAISGLLAAREASLAPAPKALTAS